MEFLGWRLFLFFAAVVASGAAAKYAFPSEVKQFMVFESSYMNHLSIGTVVTCATTGIVPIAQIFGSLENFARLFAPPPPRYVFGCFVFAH